VLAEPIFWYGLALKIAMTAGIVVAASVIVERSGPFIGALIAALPTAGGAALIILALEHPPEFIAAGIIGSLVANAAGAVFALTYAALAQRRSLPVSLGGAFMIWLALVLTARAVEWIPATAVLLNAVVYPATIVLGSRFRSTGASRRVAFSGADLAWRAGVVTLCVITVTIASNSIGSYLSGAFAFFPVAMGSFFIILHSRLGGPAAASVAAHVQAPLIGLGIGMVAVHYLAVLLGVWWAYLIGLAIGGAWNALLWTLRQRSTPR
jgi:uncharacterized membrane protein (GlpM family)